MGQDLRGAHEAFLLKVLDGGELLVLGSDAHGTAYGLLEYRGSSASRPGSGGPTPRPHSGSTSSCRPATAVGSSPTWPTAASSSTTRTGA
jgi:hypothetical protein